MAEPSTPCRWGAMSVLMRLKNKIKEKVFWYRILNEPVSPPDASQTGPNNWTDSQHFDNEGSTPNHPDFQHYDAHQGFHNPTSQLGPNDDLFSQMLHGEGMMLDPSEESATSHEQEAFITLADFGIDNHQQWIAQRGLAYSTSQPVYPLYGMAEEYTDARAEMPDNHSSLQRGYSAPPHLGHHLSTVEKAEIMDTGDSSHLSSVQQSSAVEWQRILFLQQFLGVDGIVRAGPGWKVVLTIVSAFKRISGLIQRRRQQKTAEVQTAVTTPRRIKWGEVTKYKGIRPRNGKWVSEIRIGGTLEKVWLGSYNTEKEAALAFDAGKHHCSLKRTRGFNFSDSPRLLGPPQNFAHLDAVQRRTKIQRLAEDHARAYGSADIR